MKKYKHLFAGLLLCMCLAQPLAAEDMLSGLVNSLQTVARSLTRAVTSDAQLVSAPPSLNFGESAPAVQAAPVPVKINSLTVAAKADRTLEVVYSFAAPVFSTAEGGYDQLKVAGLAGMGQPGTPELPYKTGTLLLPAGYHVLSLEYENLDSTVYQNKRLAPAQPAVPVGFAEPERVTADMVAYASSVANVILTADTAQSLAGYQLLPISLTPVTYFAGERKLIFSRQVKVRVKLAKDTVIRTSSVRPASVRQLSAATDMLRELIDNPTDLAAQVQLQTSAIHTSAITVPYDLLIIGPQAFASAYQSLIDYKITQGLKAVFVSTEEIYSTTAGRDNAEKIKNYIRTFYLSHGIQYVILGGDVELVPTRKLLSYCPSYGGPDDANMNTDVYFACLDDNWDANNNGVYAEKGENFDRLAEVSVGRFPASTAAQVVSMVAKTIAFQSLDPTSAFVKNIVVMGENLDSRTLGSYYTSYVGPSFSGKYNLNTYADDVRSWNGSTLINVLSNNTGQLVSHMGHSNYNYNARLYTSDVASIHNSNPYIYYSGGCFPNYFVFSDSISEAHLTSSQGAAAFIGNSHYGWYYPGRGDGPSARYAYDFGKAITERNLNAIGKAVTNARERSLGYWTINDGYNCDRFLYFAINILGDPSLPVITDFSPKKGAMISNAFKTWEKGVLVVRFSAVGSNVQSLGLYYRTSDGDTWKVLQTQSAVSQNYTLDTQQFADTARFQLKAVAQYPDGTLDSTVSVFGIDNHAPQLSTNVVAKVYNEDVSVNLTSVDTASGVNTVIFSVGDIRNQVYSGPITLSQGGNYTLSYTAIDNAGNVQPTVSVTFSIDRTNQDGFPVQLSGAIYGVPAYKDIDGDGYSEIAVQSNGGNVYLLKHNGAPFTGWENGRMVGVKGAASPAIADIDRDGRDEIIVFGSFAGLSVYKLDGTLKWRSLASGLSNNSSPVIADINNDGSPDVLIAADGKLFALDGQAGTLLAGFPVDLSGGMSLDIFGTPAVGDINGDGKLEIATAFSDAVRSYFKVYRSDGSLLWSKITPAKWMTCSPVMGDINNDGKVELIFAGGEEASVYVFDPDGNALPGFPFKVGSGHFAFSPALADLRGDGYLEIVLPLFNPGQNKLYALQSDGSVLPGFPFNSGAEISSGALIGDLDGDGQPDVLIGGNSSQLHAYNLSGQELLNFPKNIGGTLSLSPVLLDLDNDGRTDILTGDWTGRVSAWKTDGLFRPEVIPWGTFAHDSYHTGFFQTLFLEEPAGYKTVSGYAPIKVRTFNNGAWISRVDFEYSLDTSDGFNGTWKKMAGQSSQIAQIQWDTQPKASQQNVWVRARALTQDGKASPYVRRKLYVDNQPPANVTNLTVTDPQDNGDALQVAWSKSVDDGAGVNDLLSYTLVWNDGVQDFQAVLSKGTTSYRIPTVKTRAYSVYVKAFDGYNTNQTALLGAITPKDEFPPDPISGLLASDVPSDNGGQVQLRWNHSSTFKFDDLSLSYKIYRRESSALPWQLVVKDWRDNKFVDLYASANRVYDYKVVVTDGSNEVESPVVSGNSRDDLAPAIPSSVGIYDVPGDNGDALLAIWSLSPDDGEGAQDLLKYILHINQSVIDVPSGSTQYTLTKVQKNSLFSFYLETLDISGNSARSQTVSCYSRDNVPPRLTTLNIADVLGDQGIALQLDWPRSPDDGSGLSDVTAYTLYRRFAGDSSDGVSVSRTVADGRAVYSLQNAASQPYEYRLGISDGYNVAYSSWVIGVPVDNIPPQLPTSFTVADNPSDNGRALLVRWTRSGDDGAGAKDVSAYNLYRQDETTDWMAVTSLPPGTISYLDSGLDNTKTYTYKLEVRDNLNVVSLLAAGAVAPKDNLPPGIVGGVIATDNPFDQGGAILMSWQKNNDDTQAYMLCRNDLPLVTLNTQTSSYLDIIPQDNLAYFYVVKAYDGTYYSRSVTVSALARDNLVNPPVLVAVEDVPSDNGGSVTLRWTQPTAEPNALKYVLYRNAQSVAVLDTKTLSYTDLSATRNLTFSYQIKIVDTLGNESFSNALSGGSVDNIPPLPVSLQGADHAADNGEAVDLTWSYSRVEADVLYSLVRNGVTLTTFNYLLQTYTDPTTQANTDYRYSILASDGSNGVAGNTVTVRALDNLPPEVPRLLTVRDVPSDNGGVLQLSWQAPIARDVKASQLWRSGDGSVFNLIATVTGLSYQDTVSNNRQYSYKLTAFDGTYTATSDVASGKASDNCPPAAVTGFSVTDTRQDQGTALTLSWNLPQEMGVTYSLYRDDGMLFANVMSNGWQDNGLTPGKTYTYYLLSDDGTYQVKSSRLSGIPLDDFVSPVRQLVASDVPGTQGHALDLNWLLPTDSDLARIELYREARLLTTLTKSTTTYRDTTVTAGIVYSYAVRTVDAQNNQNNVTLSFSPFDNVPPEAPTNLLVTDPLDNGGALTLSWKKSLSSDVVRYEIYQRSKDSQGSEGEWTLLGSKVPSGDVMTWPLSGLALTSQYAFQIAACDGANKTYGASSGYVFAHDEILPQPVVVTALDNPDDHGGQLRLTWTASDRDVVLYRVLRDGQEIAVTRSLTYLDSVNQGSYMVIAEDASGNQGKSGATARVTAFANIPQLLVSDVPQDNGSRLSISWNGEDPQFKALSLARRLASGGGYLTVKTISVETRFVDSGLTKDQGYVYALTYRNSSGTHILESPISAPLDDITPAVITDLKAEMVPGYSGTSVRVNWTALSAGNIRWLDVYKKPSNGSWQRIVTLNVSSMEFVDQDILPGITYNYRIDSVSSLASAAGNTAAVRTYDDTPPEAPLVSDVGADRGTQLRVSWSLAGVDRIIKTLNGVRETIQVPLGSTSSVVASLSPDSAYQFQVVIYRDGHAVESRLSSAVTPRIDVYTSAGPSGLRVQDIYVDNGNSLLLSWNKSVDDGAGFNDVIAYQIYQDDQPLAKVNRGEVMCRVSGLLPDYQRPAGYSFKVSALNSFQIEAFSNVSTGSPHDKLAPASPGGFSLVPSSIADEIRLLWTLNSSDTRSYRLYRNGVLYQQLNASQNSFTDSGLTYGVAYSYQLSALDNVGNESPKTSALSKVPVLTAVLKPGLNLVSVPYQASGVRLGACIPDPALTIYRWNGSAFDNLDPLLQPGAAHFVRVNSRVTLDLTTPVRVNADVSVSLIRGWNLIADPFITPLTLTALKFVDGAITYTYAEAVTRRLIAAKVFTLSADGSSYVETSGLTPFNGAWLKTFKNLVIVYPVAAAASVSYQTASVLNSQASGWSLTVSANGAAVVVGQQAVASDGYDPLDAYVPPSAADQGLGLYIEHSNWQEFSGWFRSDIRQQDGRWSLLVKGATHNVTPVVIQGADSLPPDKMLLVTDARGNAIPVDAQGRFLLPTLTASTVFTLQVLSTGIAFEVTKPLVYPNPCNINQTAVKLKFNANNAGEGILKIFALNGRQIYAEAISFASGDNVLTWDGVANDGAKPGSGVYFFILELNALDGTQLKKKDKFVIWNN